MPFIVVTLSNIARTVRQVYCRNQAQSGANHVAQQAFLRAARAHFTANFPVNPAQIHQAGPMINQPRPGRGAITI